MNYWYISLENTYLKNGKVRQVEIRSSYSIIEMKKEASPMEINEHKLIELGLGFFSSDHIQSNYENHCKRIALSDKLRAKGDFLFTLEE